ncbi:MAG: T9SS type A sorting domain-containing protein [Bacteroidota bacterium]
MKTPTILMMLILFQIVASSQNTIHYEYDANGNRFKRWMLPPQPLMSPPNNPNNKNSSVADDINALISADSFSQTKIETDIASDITDIVEREIRVFPNPLQEKLNITLNGLASSTKYSLQVFDGAARLFYKEDAIKNQTEINMQQAHQGIYYLVIQAKDGKRMFWKLVKE